MEEVEILQAIQEIDDQIDHYEAELFWLQGEAGRQRDAWGATSKLIEDDITTVIAAIEAEECDRNDLKTQLQATQSSRDNPAWGSF